MCIHILRFYHDLCPHQSTVPSCGPFYIPPQKCTAILRALSFYHSQPDRLPEMCPTPCPRSCEPVWGTTACRGNVLCQFRPGKCDICTRVDELLGMARCLSKRIGLSTSPDPSISEDDHYSLFAHHKWYRFCGAGRDIAEGGLCQPTDALYEPLILQRPPKSRAYITDQALHEFITRVLTQKQMLRLDARSIWFWTTFSEQYAPELLLQEVRALSSVLSQQGENRGHGKEAQTVEKFQTGAPVYFGNETRHKPVLLTAAGEVLDEDTAAEQYWRQDCRILSRCAPAGYEQHLPRPCSRHGSLDVPCYRPCEHGDAQIIHEKRLERTSSADGRSARTRHRRRRDTISSTIPKPPGTPPFRRQSASLHEGHCYESHPIGEAKQISGFVAKQEWMNGIDGPSHEAAMKRAIEVSNMVYEKLSNGRDTREDMCNSGCCNYMVFDNRARTA